MGRFVRKEIAAMNKRQLKYDIGEEKKYSKKESCSLA